MSAQDPLFELAEHRLQLRRRRPALAQVGLEAAGELFVLVDADLVSRLDAEPLQQGIQVGAQLRRCILGRGQVAVDLEEEVPGFVQERGQVCAFEQADLQRPVPIWIWPRGAAAFEEDVPGQHLGGVRQRHTQVCRCPSIGSSCTISPPVRSASVRA